MRFLLVVLPLVLLSAEAKAFDCSTLMKLVEHAETARDAVDAGLSLAEAALKKSNASLMAARRTEEKAEEAYETARDKVESVCANLPSTECRKCVGCLKFDSCCRKVWGKEICSPCPKWNDCCFKILNPRCNLIAAAKKIACTAARAAATVTENVLEGVTRALNAAADRVSVANSVLEAKQATHDELQSRVDDLQEKRKEAG
eukprot:m.91258 g.91258  ORF g.91258 m.91258 type:complete len:202 (+) comp36678_c0_seq1:892-1497(+)